MSTLQNVSKVIIGVLIIVIALWFAFVDPGNWGWGRALVDVILGGLQLLVIIIGIGLVILGLVDLNN